MLYIVGTPIGNLREITGYAIEILNSVDYILCEDTRTSAVLLNHYNINKPTRSYHKFNETSMLDSVVSDLRSGKNIALISDAGMPCVSDPGKILVNRLIEENIEYTVVSGPSALINAFILSGFDAPFTFVGFLPKTKSKARELVRSFANTPSTLIFYSPAHNVVEDVALLNDVLHDRRACVVREISKKFEECVHFNLSEGYTGAVKGEFVIVVEYKETVNSEDTPIEKLNKYIGGGVDKMSAIKQVAKEYKMKKNDVYKLLLGDK